MAEYSNSGLQRINPALRSGWILNSGPLGPQTAGPRRLHHKFVLFLFQGDIISLVRKVDSNWYEGRVGDRKGIVPSSYLEVRGLNSFVILLAMSLSCASQGDACKPRLHAPLLPAFGKERLLVT